MINDELKKEAAQIIAQAESPEGQQRANELFEQYKAQRQRPLIDLKEQDIMKVLKASYIAERFFGKSRSWICHKLNHDMRNGKRDDFTEDERKKLKEALDTIAFEIQTLSDSM